MDISDPVQLVSYAVDAMCSRYPTQYPWWERLHAVAYLCSNLPVQ